MKPSDPSAFSLVFLNPKRLKVRVVETLSLLGRVCQIETRAGAFMVYVPLMPVIPGHVGSKLEFQPELQKLHRTPEE
jgi:hypothetical protein